GLAGAVEMLRRAVAPVFGVGRAPRLAVNGVLPPPERPPACAEGRHFAFLGRRRRRPVPGAGPGHDESFPSDARKRPRAGRREGREGVRSAGPEPGDNETNRFDSRLTLRAEIGRKLASGGGLIAL